MLPTVDLGSSATASKIAELIKFGHPGVKTIGYGQQLTFAKDGVKRNFDAIIKGEGEQTIVKIIEDGLRGEVGPHYPDVLDNLPLLTSEVLFHKPAPEDWDYIMSNRGCPYRCTFCYQPALRGKEIRFFSTERFVQEILYRIQTFGTKGFYFADMIFPLGKKRTLERCAVIKEKVKDVYPEFHWWCEARVDSVTDEETAQAMKNAGCTHLKFGVEMADDRMLKVIQKDINLAKVEKGFQIAQKVGLKTTAYVLLGCPGFVDQDYQNMFEYFKNLKADNYVINIAVPYIGTKLYEQIAPQLKAKGLYIEGEEGFNHTADAMIDFWGISKETIEMFFSLLGKRDDSGFRTYSRKIGDPKDGISLEYVNQERNDDEPSSVE